MITQRINIQNLPSWIRFSILLFSISSSTCFISAQDLVINEFMASNSTILSDPDDAEFSDWIEIANVSAGLIDIGGYFLTDNLSDTTKWQFPAGTTISAGSYLVIWADGKNKVGSAIHTNFKLEKGGKRSGSIHL